MTVERLRSNEQRMIGQQILMARLDAGWSQRALADRAGVTAVTVNSVERGRHNPSPLTRAKIAKALGRPVDAWIAPLGTNTADAD